MNITKEQVRNIAKEMEEALQSIITKHGFKSIKHVGGNYSASSFKVSFEVNMESAEANLASLFKQYGLPEDSLNKKIALGGRTYAIVDVKPQNPAKPIIIVGTGGGRYKVSVAEVKRALDIAPKPGTLIKRPVPGMEGVMTPELKAKFQALASRLSPENLSCDGELNKIQIGMRKSQIMKEWAALEAELGRKVPQSEFPI